MCFHSHFMSLKVLSDSLQVLLPVILDQLPYFKVSCGEETSFLDENRKRRVFKLRKERRGNKEKCQIGQIRQKKKK